MMGHRVDDFLSRNHPFRIIVFYEFPNNMVCSNEVFNDIDWRSPADLLLVPKRRTTKNWIIKPGTNKTHPDGEYKIAGGIVWEIEIISEDNFQIQEEQKDKNLLFDEIFATMRRVSYKRRRRRRTILLNEVAVTECN